MNRNLKQFFSLLWKSLLFWSIALGLFGIFRYYGIGDNEDILTNENLANRNFSMIIFNHVVTGFL
ncbi:MAG: adenylate/guanylate cyclase domain-containing protein, partial [Flavobacteriaceae bacterium]|nr:adenylate/guanylate cyclase domain-containing protein [Flavobacteriaceae bacterium]